jgi:hypothetical protein
VRRLASEPGPRGRGGADFKTNKIVALLLPEDSNARRERIVFTVRLPSLIMLVELPGQSRQKRKKKKNREEFLEANKKLLRTRE